MFAFDEREPARAPIDETDETGETDELVERVLWPEGFEGVLLTHSATGTTVDDRSEAEG